MLPSIEEENLCYSTLATCTRNETGFRIPHYFRFSNSDHNAQDVDKTFIRDNFDIYTKIKIYHQIIFSAVRSLAENNCRLDSGINGPMGCIYITRGDEFVFEGARLAQAINSSLSSLKETQFLK